MRMIAPIALLVGCILLCNVAGAVGLVVTDTGNTPWYRSLRKPSFNPPNWAFGLVWTLLYLLMGVSLFLLVRRYPATQAVLIAFAIQLILNAIWTPIFFGWHKLYLALADLVLMWVAIAGTILLAWPQSPAAAMLLIPYLMWVSYAGVLNASIVRLNQAS